MAALLNKLFFVFKISLLRDYRVKYYDYIVKVVQFNSMRLVRITGYFLNFSFIKQNRNKMLGSGFSGCEGTKVYFQHPFPLRESYWVRDFAVHLHSSTLCLCLPNL